MFDLKHILYLVFLHLILGTPQINLYHTDRVSESNDALQHNCLRLLMYIDEKNLNRQIISFCMSEFPSKFPIEENDLVSKFTFNQLAKQNISSQQLYQWSASIDLIEQYQIYLNQLLTSNNLLLEKEIFYNCTMPKFGPKCQYEFINYYSDHFLSLYEIIDNFFRRYEYNPTNLICYTHLKCYRGPDPICLDWTEICDGKIDCLNGEFDEEHCWELEINQCQENEFRCTNGQCIPQSFYKDSYTDCIDRSDEHYNQCHMDETTFGCDDVTCQQTPLTSSCEKKRENIIIDAMYSIKDNSISEDCWLASNCILNPLYSDNNLCANNAYIETFLDTCPDMLYIPNIPILFSHIYFAYRIKRPESIMVLYICYNDSHYDPFFNVTSKMVFNNRTCYPDVTAFDISPEPGSRIRYKAPIADLYNELKRYYLIFNYTFSAICNKSNMYQCINSSKCISIYRLIDTRYDCPYMDDENITLINNTNIEKLLKKTHFICKGSNKYIHQSLVENGNCDCDEPYTCDDENYAKLNDKINLIRRNISFQTICDQYIELIPLLIDGRNETDETECQQWECDNIYTHCDGIWNCPNGIDEIDCHLLSKSKCSSNQHLCISPHTKQFMCLSIDKANDGKVDCVGGTDEPMLCRSMLDDFKYNFQFYCNEKISLSCVSYELLCDDENNCEDGNDEEFCDKSRTINRPQYMGVCQQIDIEYATDIEKFACEQIGIKQKSPLIYFSIDGIILTDENLPIHTRNKLISQLPSQYERYCHHGLDLRIWLDNKTNSTKIICFCRPSFYGSQCQYQNQRISLALQFRAFSDSWRTQFSIVILLIDDNIQPIIHSYEQINYLSTRDCYIKFNIYLLYSTRFKDLTKNYSIHIDFYEKHSLFYRGSVLLPVQFSFLPVHRLAFIVDIPRINDKIQRCSIDQCIHGKCIRYSNNPDNLTFCYCNKGWTGRYCNIQLNCTCSSDSLCIGFTANNQSICICPMNKFGPRCFLTDVTCQNGTNSTCKNGGRCIINDEYSRVDPKFTCICRKGYSGDRCEIIDNQLILLFDKNIILSQSLFIHFIQILKNKEPMRSTTLQMISLQQNTIIIRWSRPFHLVFTEFINKTYYLTVVQTIYNRSTIINKNIHSSNRCLNISELFNETFIKLNLLRRIKYYHLPCQNQSLNLSCFYDNTQFCLCYTFGKKRLANCFNFDHYMTFDCFGRNECENNGQCFQDTQDCPRRSICVCSPCYYGRRCQFTTSGFGLSLDAIIGYHIIPKFSLIEQSFIIKMSFVLTIIFMLIGLINGIFCLITFTNKSVRKVGCGLYLLGSSITTLLITIIFGLKFIILLLAQMTIISNRSFLTIQCYSIDFILRICLCMDQWLNACVAIERATTIIKGARFDKKKSKKAARFVIIIFSIVIVGSCIHEPIYRRLIEEGNDDDDDDDDFNVKRIWCIVSYSSSLHVYNSVIHIFHFFGPFMSNLISSIVLITKKSHQQLTVSTQRPFKQILREQFQEHKRLLIAPIVLVILALPRLIITFISKCMKSNNDSWLFLAGYFISFIPPMLTFVIFILPSKFYKKEFDKTIRQYRTKIQQRLCPILSR